MWWVRAAMSGWKAVAAPLVRMPSEAVRGQMLPPCPCMRQRCPTSGTRRHPQNGHVRVGKLNLVDLAGSERQSKTGATGACEAAWGCWGLFVGNMRSRWLTAALCRLQ